MNEPERKPLRPAIIAVVLIALAATLPGYFATQMLDVGGRNNSAVGLSAAMLAGVFCLSVIVGLVLLLSGRSRPGGNRRVALVATLVVAVFLLLVAFAAGTSSTEPASTTIEAS
ncbi:MAG: hypothetical protein JWL91_1054 [Sphingomonas bacterium]|nr:hypothetical protein [Sphingomonas bacterium]MDB5689178.1 hypothetical protein [Sphingomonas bacterium]